MTIKDQLNSLRTNDVYSLILFVLYKLRDVPEYRSTSELAYVLDEHNFLNLCEYFGGLTIKIPTLDEVRDIVNALLLYQLIDLDGMDYESAVKEIGFAPSQMRHIKKVYKNISTVLKDYNFNV